MVGIVVTATKRVITIMTMTTEGVVKKIKTSESLVETVSCPIKAIPSKNSNKPVDPPEDIGVMALVVIMEPVTKNLFSKGPQIPLRSRSSIKIRVLIDTGSNGDQFFHENGKHKPFSYLTRQVPKSWHMSNGTFHMHDLSRFYKS